MKTTDLWCGAASALLLAACGSSGTTTGAGGTGAGGAHASAAASTSAGTGGEKGVSSSGSTTSSSGGGSARTVTFTNKCKSAVWVGALNADKYPLPDNGGWKLDPGQSHSIGLPQQWGGRFWGRSGCTFDGAGKGSCASGDCGGKAECAGSGGKPPATLAEFTFSGFGGKDFYDISLVDGYNLPMGVAPTPGTFTKSNPGDMYDCGAPGCTSDLNATCPPELQLLDAAKSVVGCLSACEKFNTDPYCCKGANNTPATCPPQSYSMLFKAACPTAYSYAYDDKSSTFTCKGRDYDITFCP